VDLLRSFPEKRFEVTADNIFPMENPDYLKAFALNPPF
jgi:hypothetical protein